MPSFIAKINTISKDGSGYGPQNAMVRAADEAAAKKEGAAILGVREDQIEVEPFLYYPE